MARDCITLRTCRRQSIASSLEKTGFGTIVREPVDVRPRAQVRVDVSLSPGAVTESITITADAPMLDTAAVNNSVGFKDTLIQELPMIVVGTKRDITGFLNNMPGADQHEYLYTHSQRVGHSGDGRVHRWSSRERAASEGLAGREWSVPRAGR